MRITVTRKVFLIIASLIAFMSAAFFTLAHNELEGMFRSYASQARQRTAVQWADVISYFYRSDGGSWSEVDKQLKALMAVRPAGNDLPEQLIVVDPKGHLILDVGRQRGMRARSLYSIVHLQSNGRILGDLMIYGEGLDPFYEIEETVLHTMTLATLWGIIISGTLALLSGAFMARRMTRPLKRMLQAIKGITKGDLSTQIPVSSNDEFGQVALAFNEMTRQLQATERARTHLVADVAHELRIPLTIIQGQLELIQQGVREPKPEDLLPIHDEVIRLSRLVQDLHQLSQAEVGKLAVHKRPTDAIAFFQRIVEYFEIEAADKKIRLELETRDKTTDDSAAMGDSGTNGNAAAVSAKTREILIDPDRMTQVFVNLLGNAVRYTPDGGEVKVVVDLAPHELRVMVKDTGPGIAQEHLPYLFDRFYRADEDRSRNTGGTGLGLAIAKEFVVAHGGEIEVMSEVGKGTAFVVVLPLLPT
ncbi:sensor histidine kinase [Alicyclobacillus acidiphilus]|uniref:sensor histidine kinase n=1 Tax=Alicyclobacillus acidiphilus TaxID=182455 RepID=UPI0008369654|nr:ATP-binding protein [Alicyclobacillus acidiphilus]